MLRKIPFCIEKIVFFVFFDVTNNSSFIHKLKIRPVEVGMTDGLGKRVGKDSDVDTAEASDGLGAQITVVHAGKMRELLVVSGIVQMIELRIGGDAQIDDVLIKRNLFLDMFHLADANLGLNVSLAVTHRDLHVVVIMVGSVGRNTCHATFLQP